MYGIQLGLQTAHINLWDKSGLQTAHKFMKHNLVYKQLINVWNSTWSTNSSYKFMKYNFYKILQERDTNKIYEILRQTEFFYEIHLS